MYEINESGQVMKAEEVVTQHQTAIIKKPYGMAQNIAVSCAKTSLLTGEELTIAFKWQEFSLGLGEWVDNTEKTDAINIDVSGLTDQLAPEDGQAEIIFSSAEPGTHIIKTINSGIGNTYLEVTVNAA
jgi:hypothetical protein